MKEHTSKFLKTTAYLYLAFPVTYLAYAALLFNLSPMRTTRIFFSFSYWAFAVTGMVVGWGFREMTRWVRSGDPDNVEARAARHYWSRLFPNFTRGNEDD